jgi:glycerol-3-phosphate cytidylyltransferase
MLSKNILEQIQAIKSLNKKIGFTCSCFDLLHSGHVIMLNDAKSQCDILVVGLQTDPTIDRPLEKNKPVQDFEERKIMINGIKYVDYVIEYTTEAELYEILKELNPDVRIIGTDWQGKKYTGNDLPIKIHWHVRNHNYSTTDLRKRVYLAEKNKQLDYIKNK